jgi:hypothetical protein
VRGGAHDDGELDHAAATAWTDIERAAGELAVTLAVIGGRGWWRWRGGRQQLTALGKFGGAMAVGEIAVVTDAMKAVGQDVKQEASNELVCGQGVKSKNSSETPVISIVKLLHGDRDPSPRAIDRPPRALNQRWPNP